MEGPKPDKVESCFGLESSVLEKRSQALGFDDTRSGMKNL